MFSFNAVRIKGGKKTKTSRNTYRFFRFGRAGVWLGPFY